MSMDAWITMRTGHRSPVTLTQVVRGHCPGRQVQASGRPQTLSLASSQVHLF